MRILVGTLYTIENEYEECVASIQNQTHKKFEHFVIEGLPNKKAHDRLYQTFMERSDEFNLFIKVDADMVIEDPDLFMKITQRFQRRKDLDEVEIAVHDYFPNDLVWGLHAYTSRVKWELGAENLFVDTTPQYHGEKEYDSKELAPAATHCKNPSPLQSFHYGIHKAMKVIQPKRLTWHHSQAEAQWKKLRKTDEHFLETGDTCLALALLGAELTLAGRFSPDCLDYGNEELVSAVSLYSGIKKKQLLDTLDHFRRINWGFLPDDLRRSLFAVLRADAPLARGTQIILSSRLFKRARTLLSNILKGTFR